MLNIETAFIQFIKTLHTLNMLVLKFKEKKKDYFFHSEVIYLKQYFFSLD